MPRLTSLEIPHGYSLFKTDLDEVLHLLSAEWDHLKNSHIFLTGGTGFFGIWLIESILWANEKNNCQILKNIVKMEI